MNLRESRKSETCSKQPFHDIFYFVQSKDFYRQNALDLLKFGETPKNLFFLYLEKHKPTRIEFLHKLFLFQNQEHFFCPLKNFEYFSPEKTKHFVEKKKPEVCLFKTRSEFLFETF